MSVPPVYTNAINESTNNYNASLNDITNTYNTAYDNATNDYNIAVFNDNSAPSVAAATTAFNAAVAAAATAYDAAIAAANTAYTAEVAAINTASAAFVAAAITAYNAAAAAEITAYNAALAAATIIAATNGTSIPAEYVLEQIHAYDVTKSVELLMDVRILNNKLGIQKDASNILVLTPLDEYYNSSTFSFYSNSITLTSDDIISAISNGQLVDVGALSVCYRQFADYVNAYFGQGAESLQQLTPSGALHPDEFGYSFNPSEYGISTLYSSRFLPIYDIDVSALTQIFISGNGGDISGVYIQDICGQVNIPDIANTIRSIIQNNPFNNRGLYSSVIQGWIADDIFYIPSGGLTITFSVNIDQISAAFPSFPPFDTQHVSDAQINTFNHENPVPGATTLTNTFNSQSKTISQTYSVGLLIRLANLS